MQEHLIDLLNNVICLAISAVATYWSYNYVLWSIQMGAKSNVFKLPTVIGQLPILISFFLWTLYLIRDVVKSAKGLGAAASDGKGGA